jgi:hypothetical protein
MTDLLFRRPSVGKEITAYCGRCKDERTHIVAAMDGQTVRRVTCSTCGSTHNFKGTPAPRPARTPRSSRAEPRAQAAAFAVDSSRPVKSYDMHALFAAGDVISHPKFGLGEVRTSLSSTKIEVRFQEGTKLLLHNMKGDG